jgi:cell wall assembly regulator SMI1
MGTSINDSWDRIAAWFRANAAAHFELLQEPASPKELEAAARLFGFELPEDFKRLYGLVNGTDPNGESVGLFPAADEYDDMAFGPLALEQVVRKWRMLKNLLESGEFADREPESSASGVSNDWWNVGWVPFASNGGGDFFCVDTAPTPEGIRGQVISHSHESGVHKVLAPSLAVYLAELADGLDKGRFEYTDYGLQKV